MREHAAMLAAFLLLLLVAVWPGWPEPRPAAQAQEPTPTLEVVVNEVAPGRAPRPAPATSGSSCATTPHGRLT